MLLDYALRAFLGGVGAEWGWEWVEWMGVSENGCAICWCRCSGCDPFGEGGRMRACFVVLCLERLRRLLNKITRGFHCAGTAAIRIGWLDDVRAMIAAEGFQCQFGGRIG